MDFDFYDNAVQEYLTEYAEKTRCVLEKIQISQEEIETQIQGEKEKLKNS